MLTKKTSSRYSMLRYLVFLPFIASCLILLDSPSSQAARLNTTSFFIKEGAPSRFPLPEAFRNKITWGFQEKGIHPFSKEVRTHLGIDIAAPIGTPVFATADGVVLQAAEFEDWGKLIVLEHADGFQSYYAHLDEISVEEGKRVKAGMVIGKVGITGQSTGPHLHYEVHRHGEHLNPADYY